MLSRIQTSIVIVMVLLLINLYLLVEHRKEQQEGFVDVNRGNLPISVGLPPVGYSQDVTVTNSAIQAANQAAVLAARAEEMEILLSMYAAQKAMQAGNSAALARGLSTQPTAVSATGGLTSAGVLTNLSSSIQAQTAALAALGIVGMGSGSSVANYTVGLSTAASGVPSGVSYSAATSSYTLPITTN